MCTHLASACPRARTARTGDEGGPHVDPGGGGALVQPDVESVLCKRLLLLGKERTRTSAKETAGRRRSGFTCRHKARRRTNNKGLQPPAPPCLPYTIPHRAHRGLCGRQRRQLARKLDELLGPGQRLLGLPVDTQGQAAAQQLLAQVARQLLGPLATLAWFMLGGRGTQLGAGFIIRTCNCGNIGVFTAAQAAAAAQRAPAAAAVHLSGCAFTQRTKSLPLKSS